MGTGRTLVNALIGAIVSVVVSFVPFSPIVGGAVAGFLQGPDGRDGTVVGAISGAIVFLPFVAFALFVLGFLGLALVGAPVEGFAVAVFLFVFVGAIALLYTVGLSALGGYLGAYLAREYPERRASTRETIGMAPDRPARESSDLHDSRDLHDRGRLDDDRRPRE